MPSCHKCRRFFWRTGSLENHLELEHLDDLVSHIDCLGPQDDLMQLDSEPNNAEQLNIDLHDWDFGPASPIYDGLQSASGDAISDIPRPFYSRTTLVPSHPDHPRYGTLQGDNESEYDSSDESMVQRNGFYPHGIEKGCGFPLQHVPTLAEQELRSFIRNPDPYHPFKSEKELNFATWLVESGLPIKQIDALLKGNMPLDPSLPRCFKSWYLLKKQLDEFDSGLGMSSWHAGECNTTWSEDSDEIVKFYYRDIKEVAKWLLRQPYHEAHMAYTAGHRIRDGMRCYDEMWTGDWWIDVQLQSRPGETVVPLIFLSDATHLTNFSGDKKACPLYMTIGNIPHSERTKRRTYSVVLVGWLPTPPKAPSNYTAAERTAKSQRDRQIVQSALCAILSPLLDPDGCRYDALCADGRWRLCWSPLAAWIADYPEYINLLGLKYGDCIWCETPHEELQNFPPDKPPRDYAEYEALWFANTTDSIADLTGRGVNPSHNILWECGLDVGLLAKPDILHGLQLGLLDYLLQWTLHWLKDIGLRKSFKRLWLSVPAYCEMARPTKTYMDVSQYQGKEYRTVARFFYAILAATLETAKPKDNDERRDFKGVLACVEGILDFHFYACYEEHNNDTLRCMNDALQRFHDHRHIFLKYRANKATRKAAKSYRKARNEQRKNDYNDNPKHRGYAAFQHETDTVYLKILESSSHYNIPKVHHCSHYVDQVRLFGSLVGYNSSITENCHISFCKDPYRSSNKVGEYVIQILQNTSRREGFGVQRLNYNAWQCKHAKRAQDAGVSQGEQEYQCVVSGSVNATGSRSQADRNDDGAQSTAVIPRYIPELPSLPPGDTVLGSPQHLRGKNRIRTFSDLLQRIPDVEQERLYDAVHRYLAASDRRFILERDQLMCSPAELFHNCRVQVDKFQSANWETRAIRGTNTKLWHKKFVRHDWFWYRVSNKTREKSRSIQRSVLRCGEPSFAYGALGGRLPARAHFFFKVLIRDPQAPRSEPVSFEFSFADLTKPHNASPISNMPRVIKSTLGVVPAGAIDGPAHLVPLNPVESNNSLWIVNTHIDVEAWNDIYNRQQWQ